MDILTNLAAGQSDSTSIPSTCARNIGLPKDDGISLNARRLKLRNAGFRAALLPTRRLSHSPQQPAVFVRNENIENTTSGCVKARQYSSPDSTSPLNILQEIRNCSQRKAIPQSPLGDLFGFADDENEEVYGQDHTNTMSSKTGSIRTPRSRKSSRRVSSFQSTKYIEYLENELGLVNRKLESLQSPETITGQAAKIRKLEKRTQELSQHIIDWEKNFEERVNDQVFERLHGESDLRLKILTLEQTAEHKESHIVELSKELEDVKTKLEEAESIEATLSRRIDVLTELLAKSPTRTSFASSGAEFPTPTRPTKSLLQRVSTSPTRFSQRIEDFNGTSQIDSVLPVINPFSFQSNESAIETDTESQDFNIFSRPTSGIFSSRSSQTSSSRPTSMFSTASVSAWTSADEKPVARARKSRRFAPGSAGLKPLLLAANAGLQSPTRQFETLRKGHVEPQNSSDSCWESAEDLPGATSSRPKPRRPYSWAYSPSVTKHTSIQENDGPGEDTFIADAIHNDDLPAYLRHLAVEESIGSGNKSQRGSLFPPAKLSLYQELNAEQSLTGSPDGLFQACDSPASVIISQVSQNSPNLSKEQNQCLQPDALAVANDSFVSEFSETIIGSELEQHRIEPRSPSPISQPQIPYLIGFITTFKQKPLHLAREILLQALSRGSARLGRLIWRVVDLFLMPRRRSEFTSASRKSTTNYPGFSFGYSSPPSSKPGSTRSASAVGATKVDHCVNDIPNHRLEIAKLFSKLQVFAFPASTHQRSHHCSCCIEPPRRRSMQLWSKLLLVIAVAIGYAVLEGPASVLDMERLDRCTTDTPLSARKDDE